jgi:hypothetical protein
MLVLLTIVAAFLIVGVYSLRIIAAALQTLLSAEQKQNVKLCEIRTSQEISGHKAVQMSPGPLNHNDETSRQNIENSLVLVAKAQDQGHQLQHKVAITFVWIFFTFLTRAAFIVFYGIVMSSQDFDNNCSLDNCNPCKNKYAHMNFWILYTPALQHTIMLIASPLALIVALWGMSDVRAIEQMSSSYAKLRHRWRMMRR